MKNISLFIALSFFVSCKKNKLGGDSYIKGTAVHHSRFIAYTRVFIKFNATEFPGSDTTFYDAKVTADMAGNYEIKCYKGQYYIYGVGYDDQIKQTVTGGVPVKIRNGETVVTDLPVTEN